MTLGTLCVLILHWKIKMITQQFKFLFIQNSYIRTRLSFRLNHSNNENSLVNVSKRTVHIKDTLDFRCNQVQQSNVSFGTSNVNLKV